MRKIKIMCFLIILLSIVSCDGIKLIGKYDAKIDEGIEAVSKDCSIIFVKIDNNIDDSTDYSYKFFKNDYIKIEAELKSILTRANGLSNYKIIIQQIEILQISIKTLQKDHQSGFVSSKEINIEELKNTIKIDEKNIVKNISNILALQEKLKRKI